MKKLILTCLLLLAPVAAWAITYPSGMLDSVTPQVKLWLPASNDTISAADPMTVFVEYVDYDFQPDFVTNPATHYASSSTIDGVFIPEVQLDGTGHFHIYTQKLLGSGFADVAVDVSGAFCPINLFNPNTVHYADPDESHGAIIGSCPPLQEPGDYRVCVVAETHTHSQRMKARPRDFPPTDCVRIKAE